MMRGYRVMAIVSYIRKGHAQVCSQDLYIRAYVHAAIATDNSELYSYPPCMHALAIWNVVLLDVLLYS